MQKFRKIKLIGSAIGNCGRLNGCESAPYQISNALANQQGILINSDVVAYTGSTHDVLEQRDFFLSVARRANRAIEKNIFPIFIGGDHSCAIGAWSGVASKLEENQQELGLIWIDAHLDAHQPDNSETGNLHGMPVAHLLGYGHPELTHILSKKAKIKPENIVYFGIRSFEKSEEDFLKELGVKIYYQDMLENNNFVEVFLSEFNSLALKTNGNVGISLDLDGLDPTQIKAVGTPVDNGIAPENILSILELIDIDNLIAFEIAEYNPSLDDGCTIKYVMRLLKHLIGLVRNNSQDY